MYISRSCLSKNNGQCENADFSGYIGHARSVATKVHKVREGQGLAYRWAAHGTLRAGGKRGQSLQSTGYLISFILAIFITVAGQQLSFIFRLQGNLTELSVPSGFGEALDLPVGILD